MTLDWSTDAGVDLHLDVDLGARVGRRAAVEDALRDAISAGRLVPGTRLPATRALARDLGVARGTVTDAYDQLVAEGWLVARQGSGTVVATLREALPHEAVAAPPPLPTIGPAGGPDFRVRPRHDFRPGTPDVSAFPRREWAAALRRALRDAPDEALLYGDPRGRPELREALSDYLARARGVRTHPDRVLVCNGWVQAVALITSALRARGATAIAMEDPCMPGYRAAAVGAGLAVRPIPVDEHGADPAVLETFGQVAAVLLTPAHQYPTGTTLTRARRPAFTAWARDNEALIVEDDYDGEFRYDRQPIGALQGLDPDCVVYAGTASKSLAPGLRLGWLALPADFVEPVAEAKALADRHTGVLDQLALAELIVSGALDRHIRRSRASYRRRRDLLLAMLSERVPLVHTRGIAAGLHLVVGLPEPGPDEAEVVAHLAAQGVAVHDVSRYWHDPAARRRGVVVGFGTPPEHGFRAAAEALTDGLAELYG